MGETDLHRQDMVDLIESLKLFYRGQRVYVTGNILVFYQPGNKRKHISPDVMVVKGIDPHMRDNYLIWQEGKGPDVVIEVTSASTRHEDVAKKYKLYRDVIKVPEYFLFDPRGEFLNPPLLGYRLVGDQYVVIEPTDGRLPSEVLGLYLERHGVELRLWDGSVGKWIPTLVEACAEAEAACKQAEEATKLAQHRAEAEIEQMRQEIEALRRRVNSA